MQQIIKQAFGCTRSGRTVDSYTLVNRNGASVKVITYGGTIVSVNMPDKGGRLADVVLGFDDLQSYENQDVYIGAVIGRSSSRIKHGELMINGVNYQLSCNQNSHHLHGGDEGFDRKVWNAQICQDALKLCYISADGEEGYPGELRVTITYRLTDDNELILDYDAVCNQDTICNLTNHSYFNLTGDANNSVLSHKLKLHADYYTESDKELLSTGNVVSVASTPLDFLNFKTLAENIESSFSQLQFANGYDQNYIINRDAVGLELAAELFDETSGRLMKCYTTMPGIQLYSSNFLDGILIGKNHIAYQKHCALCLETQFFPGNIQFENFPTSVLKADTPYHHTTVYRFETVSDLVKQ